MPLTWQPQLAEGPEQPAQAEQAVEQAVEPAVRLCSLDPPLGQCQALRQWFLEVLKAKEAA